MINCALAAIFTSAGSQAGAAVPTHKLAAAVVQAVIPTLAMEETIATGCRRGKRAVAICGGAVGGVTETDDAFTALTPCRGAEGVTCSTIALLNTFATAPTRWCGSGCRGAATWGGAVADAARLLDAALAVSCLVPTRPVARVRFPVVYACAAAIIIATTSVTPLAA